MGSANTNALSLDSFDSCRKTDPSHQALCFDGNNVTTGNSIAPTRSFVVLPTKPLRRPSFEGADIAVRYPPQALDGFLGAAPASRRSRGGASVYGTDDAPGRSPPVLSRSLDGFHSERSSVGSGRAASPRGTHDAPGSKPALDHHISQAPSNRRPLQSKSLDGDLTKAPRSRHRRRTTTATTGAPPVRRRPPRPTRSSDLVHQMDAIVNGNNNAPPLDP